MFNCVHLLQEGHINMTLELLSRGADAHLLNKNGRSGMQICLLMLYLYCKDGK